MMMRIARWTAIIVGVLLVVLTIVAALGSRTAPLRKLVIATLAERLDSEVELNAFSVDLFPSVQVAGSGLVIRHLGRHDVPPLVSIRSFRLEGGLMGLLQRPRRFRTVALTGLEINIPPGGIKNAAKSATEGSPSAAAPPQAAPPQTPQKPEAEAKKNDDGHDGRAAIIVDRVIAEDATLSLIPRRADKSPRVFDIHHLTLDGLGLGQPMPFEATLTNPQPRGLIKTSGTFGPWGREEPATTPLTGTYHYDDVDLGTVKGIGGRLTSTGSFSGQLGRIDVTGETRTPDFRVNVAGNPVPLETKFIAVVDGTDGDTYLNDVAITFLATHMSAKGKIFGVKGVKGKTVDLDVTIAEGRIEDVLRLALKGEEPVMTGRVDLRAHFNLPAGPDDVLDRLALAGEFGVGGANFTDDDVQTKLSGMSQRAQGKDPEKGPDTVLSNLRGRFTLNKGLLRLSGATFGIPGANVRVAGSYGLRSEELEFDGMLRMQATISEAAGGGMKSIFLKVVDPFFRKKGAGAVLPIRIRGTRKEPKFGLDVKKALTPK